MVEPAFVMGSKGFLILSVIFLECLLRGQSLTRLTGSLYNPQISFCPRVEQRSRSLHSQWSAYPTGQASIKLDQNHLSAPYQLIGVKLS